MWPSGCPLSGTAGPVADASELVHGTAVALQGRAALFRGSSGVGKSDLALRCLGVAPGGLIPQPFELVADDQVVAVAEGDRVIVSAPPAIRGLLEVRRIGIIALRGSIEAELVLVIDLVTGSAYDRMPGPLAPVPVAGLPLPRIELDPWELSAPLKVAVALMKTRQI